MAKSVISKSAISQKIQKECSTIEDDLFASYFSQQVRYSPKFILRSPNKENLNPHKDQDQLGSDEKSLLVSPDQLILPNHRTNSRFPGGSPQQEEKCLKESKISSEKEIRSLEDSFGTIMSIDQIDKEADSIITGKVLNKQQFTFGKKKIGPTSADSGRYVTRSPRFYLERPEVERPDIDANTINSSGQKSFIILSSEEKLKEEPGAERKLTKKESKTLLQAPVKCSKPEGSHSVTQTSNSLHPEKLASSSPSHGSSSSLARRCPRSASTTPRASGRRSPPAKLPVSLELRLRRMRKSRNS